MAELPSWVDLGDHGIWQRPAEKPTVGQFFDQTWADAQRVSNQDANIRNYMEAFDAVNDRIRQATGEALDNPMAWSGGPIAALQAATAYSRQGVEQIDPVRDWRRRIGELRTKHPDKLPWDEIENEPSRLAWEKMRATREKTTEMSEALGMVEGSQVPLVGKIPIAGPILGTGPAFLYNLAHSPRYTLAQLGAGFGAQMTSPLDATVNLMSFGAGGAAKSILRNAAINAAVNASGQALLSAPKQISYREAGLPYGWEVWANEVGSAAVMGGVIDAMVRYPARTLLRRYGRDVPAGEMFSKNTERAGFFTDLPKTLDLPERPPVRETENVSRETWDKAKAGDVEALREVATRTGAIEDPAVKGALDYAELGGAIDDAMIQRFREMGIDHGEGLRTVATVMANPERFARVPEVRSDGAPLLREEGHQLMARNEAEVRQVTAGLDARIARGVELGLEAGLPSVVAAVRDAVARVGADGPDKARAGFLEALAKASEAMGGPQRMADHIAIHGSTDVLEVAAAMRRAPDLVDKTVPMGTDFARAAYAVSKLAEDAFARVAAGEVPAKIGELVANEVPPEHQARVLDDLKKAAPRSVQEARAMLDDLLPSEQPRSEMPLDGGAKVDDPAGPEAKAQTERLADEHAEAIKAAEAPIKERQKLESRIEDLKGEIAKLEHDNAALARIADQPEMVVADGTPSRDAYVAQALRNLRSTSRTASGVVDVSASPAKKLAIAEGLSAENAAATAVANFSAVIGGIYDRLSGLPRTGAEMAAWIDKIASDVSAGILRDGVLYRADDSPEYPYTKVESLELAHRQFSTELVDRLNDPKANPVETAAWIEWRANLTDHFWADGVGKTSKALAAVPLMRDGLPLPEYRSNKEFFEHAGRKRYDPNNGPDSYLDADWRVFLAYYKTLMPLRRETIEAPGFGTPEFERTRSFVLDGRQVRGYAQAIEWIERKFAAYAGGDLRREKRAVVVLGPPGSGKSSTIEPLARHIGAAIVNSDDPKFILPEFKLGAEVVHEEASALAKRVQARLLDAGSNIIIEKLGDNQSSILKLVRGLREIDGYTVDVVDVSASRGTLIERIAERFKRTGRNVPIHILDAAIAGIGNTLKALDGSGLIRERISVDTNGPSPHIISTSQHLGADLEKALQTSLRQRSLVPGGGRPERGRLLGEAREGKAREGEADGPSRQAIAAKQRDLIDAELQLHALKAERVADDPSALYRLVMESAAVRRQRDLDDAIRSALGFAGRVLPEGTAVEVKPDAQMIHVGKDGTRYQLDATSDPRTGEIALALHALDPAARIGHEGVHTLVTLGHISPEELASIAKAAREAGVFGNEAKYREAYKDRPNLEALIEEEAAAHLIEAVVAGKVKVDLPATLLDHIKALIERIRSYLNGAGFHTPEDVIHAILSGEAARRTARDAWMRKQDYSAVAVKNEPLAALADGDALTIADKIANIESASAALERLPRNGRRPLNDAYDLITSPSVGRAIYYVVLKGKPLEDRRGNIKAIGRFDVKPAQRIDVAGVEVTNARVDERHQRKGIASAAYEAIANDMADVGGLSPSPRDQLSPDAQSFWSKRLGHQMFAFAGERARTADHDALAQAKRMEGDGKPREAIWTETGWFRGVDGKWRFEIDDSAFAATVRIRPSGYLDNLSSTLGMGGILRHDALVAAYPDLARTRVVQTATTDRTFYGYGDKEFIDGKWRDAPEKTVQIGIPQYREEWLRGARKGETADVNEPLPGNFEAVSLRSMGMHELQHAAQGQEGFYLDGASSSAVAQRSIADYRRMANEVEARTVQKRMDMTGADRRARPPWLDYDVPEDQQIVRFADGKSVSATELNELKSGHSPRSGALFAINDDDGKIVAFPSRKMPEGYRPAEARDFEAVVMDALTRPALTDAEILQAIRPISTFMTQRYELSNMKMPIRDPHAYGNTVLAMARAFRSLEENVGQTPTWPALNLYVTDRGRFRVFDDGYDVRGGIEIPVGASQKQIEAFFRDSGIWQTRRPPDNDLFAIRTPLHDEMELQDRMGMLADLARACR